MVEAAAETSLDEFNSDLEQGLSDIDGIEDLGAWEELQAELNDKQSKPSGEQEALDDVWRDELVDIAGKKLSLLISFESPLHQVEFEVPDHQPVRNAYLDPEQPDAEAKIDILNEHFTEGVKKVLNERLEIARDAAA